MTDAKIKVATTERKLRSFWPGLEIFDDFDAAAGFGSVIKMIRPGEGSGRGFVFFKYEIIKS